MKNPNQPTHSDGDIEIGKPHAEAPVSEPARDDGSAKIADEEVSDLEDADGEVESSGQREGMGRGEKPRKLKQNTK